MVNYMGRTKNFKEESQVVCFRFPKSFVDSKPSEESSVGLWIWKLLKDKIAYVPVKQEHQQFNGQHKESIKFFNAFYIELLTIAENFKDDNGKSLLEFILEKAGIDEQAKIFEEMTK